LARSERRLAFGARQDRQRHRREKPP
jgi:hypothetical protein